MTNKSEPLEELKSILDQLRKCLGVPENHSIIEHTKELMKGENEIVVAAKIADRMQKCGYSFMVASPGELTASGGLFRNNKWRAIFTQFAMTPFQVHNLDVAAEGDTFAEAIWLAAEKARPGWLKEIGMSR